MLSDSSLTNILTVSGVSQIRYRAYQQCCSRSSLKTYFTQQDPSASPTNQILLITAYKQLIEQNIPCMWQMQPQPKPSTSNSSNNSNDMDIQPENLILELWVFWFDDRHTGLIDANILLKDLEELRVGSFTWENVSLKNTLRSNACTLVTVVMEYKLFIKAVRNLIVPYMLKKNVLPLGDFFVFPPSYLEPAVGEGEDYNRSTLLCCTYNIYLASTNLIFQPNTRRIRLRHVTFSDIHTRAKALLSPTGEQAHLIPTKSHLSASLEEQLLQQWASLLQLPLSSLKSNSDDLPELICVRMSWGETILYPTRLIFLLTPTKQSPSSQAGMNGIMGYNHGLVEEIAQKWNREIWLNQIFSSHHHQNNKHKTSIDYWSYSSPRLNTTMTALDSLAASSLPTPNSMNSNDFNSPSSSSPSSSSTLAPAGVLIKALEENVHYSPLMASRTVATPSSPLPRQDFDDDNDKNYGSNNGDTPGGGSVNVNGNNDGNSIINNGLKNNQTSLLDFVQQYFTTDGSINELSIQANGNMEGLSMINTNIVSTTTAGIDMMQQQDDHLITSPNLIQQQQQTNNNNISTTNTPYQNTDLISNISYSLPPQMSYNSSSSPSATAHQQSTPQQSLQQQPQQPQTPSTDNRVNNINNNNNNNDSNNNNSNNNNNGLDINNMDAMDSMVYDISTSWGDDSGLDNLGLELDVTEEDFNYFEDEPTKPVVASSISAPNNDVISDLQSMDVFQVKQEPMQQQQQQDMLLDTLDFSTRPESTMVTDSTLEGLLDVAQYDGMVLDTPTQNLHGENEHLVSSSTSMINPYSTTTTSIKSEINDVVQDQFSNINISSLPTTNNNINDMNNDSHDHHHQQEQQQNDNIMINNNNNIKNEISELKLNVKKEPWPSIYGTNKENQLVPPSFAPIIITTPVNDAKYMYGGKFTYNPEDAEKNDHQHGFIFGMNKNESDQQQQQQQPQRRHKKKKDRTYRPDYIPIVKKKHLKKKNDEKDQNDKLLLDKDGDNIMMDATDGFHDQQQHMNKNDSGIQSSSGRNTNGNNSSYDNDDSSSSDSGNDSNSSSSGDDDDSDSDNDDNHSMMSHHTNSNSSILLQQHLQRLGGGDENEKISTSSSSPLHKMIVEKELGEISSCNTSINNNNNNSEDNHSLTSITTTGTYHGGSGNGGYVDDEGLSHWLEGFTKAQTIYLHRLIADVKIIQGGKRRYQLNKLDLDYDTPFASTVLPESIHPDRYQTQDYLSLYTLCQQAALGGYPFTGGLAEVTASGGQVATGESARMLIARRRDIVQNARGGATHVPCLPCDFDLVTRDFKSILGEIFDPPTNTSDEPIPLNVTDFNSSVSVNGPLNVQQYYELSESNQTHSKYGKYQVKKRRPAEPNFDTLYTPDIVVGRHDEFIEGSPKMIDFWDKLRLEPYSSKKNISYFVVCPNNDDLEPVIQTFFKGLSTVYETCSLGAHHPGNIGPYRRGIAPVSLLPEESGKSKDQKIKSYMTVCENLGHLLGGALAENIYIVIYMVNPYPYLSSNLDLSKCFVALKKAYERARLQHPSMVFPSPNIRIPSEKTRARLVMQLVPIEHIVRHSDFGGYIKNGLKEIAFSVYSKCLTVVNSRSKMITNGNGGGDNEKEDKIMTPNSTSSPSSVTTPTTISTPTTITVATTPNAVNTPGASSSSINTTTLINTPHSFITDEIYSPPYVLTKQMPDQISYSLKSSLKAPIILDQDATLHIAYGYSLDRRWMVVVWTDHRGELLEFAILRSSTRQGTPFISVFEEAWQRTKKIASQTDFPWTFVIVKLGLMFENELQAWVHVLPDEEKATIVSLDMESSLHVDTLNEQEETSSSHYYTPDTPKVSTPPSSSSQNAASSPSPNSNSGSGSGSGGGSSTTSRYNIYHTTDHSDIFTTATTAKILLLNHRVAYSRKRQRISEGVTLMEANSDPESWILPLASGYLIQVPRQQGSGTPIATSEEQFGRDPSVIELHLVYNQTPHSSYTALRDIIKRYYALSFVNSIPSAYNCLPLHIVLVDRIWRLLLVVDYS